MTNKPIMVYEGRRLGPDEKAECEDENCQSKDKRVQMLFAVDWEGKGLTLICNDCFMRRQPSWVTGHKPGESEDT